MDQVLGKNSSLKQWSGVEQAAMGSAGVSIPRGIKSCADVMLWFRHGFELTVGLTDPKGLFNTDSMT